MGASDGHSDRRTHGGEAQTRDQARAHTRAPGNCEAGPHSR